MLTNFQKGTLIESIVGKEDWIRKSVTTNGGRNEILEGWSKTGSRVIDFQVTLQELLFQKKYVTITITYKRILHKLVYFILIDNYR